MNRKTMSAMRLAISLLVIFSALRSVAAQDSRIANPGQTGMTITASASAERVRFTAPSSVAQIRLEVYDSSGRKLFDNELRGGNVLDWHLEDGQATRLADDTYLCVVTVKSLSGKLSERIGSVKIEGSVAAVQPIDASQMTAQQSQAIGPVEENASLTVLNADDNPTTTVIAHNGEEGQITRGRGALSFRIGDFYSGRDVEQMRLTAEGNLGIGITHPQVRLEVDGFIRAGQGIVFPDGTVQYSAASKTLGARSTTWDGSGGTQKQPGVPSQGRTGGRRGNGDVGPMTDGVFDVNANGGSYNINAARMGIGTANPLVRLHVGPGAAPPVTAGATLLLEEGPATSMVMKSTYGGEMFMYQDQNNGTFGTASTHPLGIRTNNINRIWVEAGGNVGIGTTSPSAKLTVAGAGAYNALGAARFDLFNTTANTGYLQHVLNDGTWQIADIASTATRMVISPLGNVGIGTTTPGYPLDVNGAVRSFRSSSNDIVVQTTGGTNSWARMWMQTPNQSWVVGTSQNFNGDQLYVYDPTFNQTRMTIQPNGGAIAFPFGNVGIGTTTPASRLQVQGSGIIESQVRSTNERAILSLDSTLGGQNRVWTLENGVFGTPGQFAIFDRTVSQARLAIDTNGNVGITGNATQSRDKGGWVKAMLYVSDAGNILRCYNGQTGASLTGGTTNTGCGFTVTKFTTGGYGVDFGFQVDDRFVSVSPKYCSGCIATNPKNTGANWEVAQSATTIDVFTFAADEPNNTRDRSFMIIMY